MTATTRAARAPVTAMKPRVLVVDVGGTHVKLYPPLPAEPVKLDSGPDLTAADMLAAVEREAAQRRWAFDAVTIGIPAPIARGRILHEPANLGGGWVGFDLRQVAGRPAKLVNDAALQALGSYRGGTMLFLGLGTGLGSALVAEGQLVPLELARLRYRKGEAEDYVGLRGLRTHGKRKWRRLVAELVAALRRALVVDEIVIGGGNSRLLKKLPEGCRLGDNALAFQGGVRLWTAPAARVQPRVRPV